MCGTTANPDISCLVLRSECVCPAVYGVDNYHHVNLYDQVNIFVNIVKFYETLSFHLMIQSVMQCIHYLLADI